MGARRWIVAAVIVLLVVVGGAYVLITLIGGEETGGTGDQSVDAPSLVEGATALHVGAAA